ncbi:hypothetical protein CEXT_690681 [Caerostris extrusa]|uniref:Uncharacterized protein n=1 Tax=Caerostris extrusa TaxID=172846 RepID=A0AAV4T1C2_CAEEX|nr:hypothetical protein CEXT_690681 [Caerostris extrusa]
MHRDSQLGRNMVDTNGDELLWKTRAPYGTLPAMQLGWLIQRLTGRVWQVTCRGRVQTSASKIDGVCLGSVFRTTCAFRFPDMGSGL